MICGIGPAYAAKLVQRFGEIIFESIDRARRDAVVEAPAFPREYPSEAPRFGKPAFEEAKQHSLRLPLHPFIRASFQRPDHLRSVAGLTVGDGCYVARMHIVVQRIQLDALLGCHRPAWCHGCRSAFPSMTQDEARKPTRFELRLPGTLADAIDDWRRRQDDIPNRAEAARRLIELGLGPLWKGKAE